MTRAVRPTGAGAVMQSRAHGEVEGDDAQTALYRRLEFFPTPPWAARAGGEIIKRLDPAAKSCWEPACGQGHMVHGLKDYFERVGASDIHAHGAGSSFDFLTETDPMASPRWDWIVTNPPFGTAAEFVQLGLKRARRGVAILARLSFIEAGERYQLFHGAQPLTVMAVCHERPSMLLGRWEPKASTATSYAWFVWVKSAFAAGQSPRLLGIPPGTRDRLTRPGDVARFGAKAATPLFASVAADEVAP